jgi:hypothetical protein
MKGIQFDCRAWDKANFGRCIVSAKALIGICGTLEMAEECLTGMGDYYESKDLSWTLETIARNAHEWLKKKGVLDAHATRNRLRMAITEQRAAHDRKGSLAKVSEGQIRDAVRDVPESQDRGLKEPDFGIDDRLDATDLA